MNVRGNVPRSSSNNEIVFAHQHYVDPSEESITNWNELREHYPKQYADRLMEIAPEQRIKRVLAIWGTPSYIKQFNQFNQRNQNIQFTSSQYEQLVLVLPRFMAGGDLFDEEDRGGQFPPDIPYRELKVLAHHVEATLMLCAAIHQQEAGALECLQGTDALTQTPPKPLFVDFKLISGDLATPELLKAPEEHMQCDDSSSLLRAADEKNIRLLAQALFRIRDLDYRCVNDGLVRLLTNRLQRVAESDDAERKAHVLRTLRGADITLASCVRGGTKEETDLVRILKTLGMTENAQSPLN
ncbi:MAG: hypothetical protein V4623_09820 [Pseudomonadota bacterium]